MGLVALGEQTVPAGIAAILIAMLPVWVAVLGRIFFAERLPAAAIVGIVIGLIGVVILVAPRRLVGRPRLRPVRDPGPAPVAPRLGLGLALLVAPSGPPAASADRDRAADGLRRRAPPAAARSWSESCARSTSRPCPAGPGSGLLYLTTIGSLVGFTTYVWLLACRAAAQDRDLRLRQPGRRLRPRQGSCWARPIEPRSVVAGAVIVFAVALIVTARSRAGRGAGDDGDPVSETVATGSARPILPD